MSRVGGSVYAEFLEMVLLHDSFINFAYGEMSMGNKQKLKVYIIYALPIAFLLVGIWAFLNVISMHYTRAISLIDWLLSGPDNIIAVLRDVDTLMGQVQRIILMRAFWICWFAGFSVSVFMLGRHIQNKKEKYSEYAVIRGKEAYHKAQTVIIRNHNKLHTKECLKLSKKLNALVERLNYESDFGYGALAIIDCENQINQKINNLSECLTDYEPDLDNQQSIEAVLNEINILLDRRAEMKKRH